MSAALLSMSLCAVTEATPIPLSEPPIYRTIELGPCVADTAGMGMRRLGINNLGMVALTRWTSQSEQRGVVWLPPAWRPIPGGFVIPPDLYGCYKLPVPAGATNTWANDINEFGVAAGAAGAAYSYDCKATAWTTGFFTGPISSTAPALACDWSVFVGLSNSLSPIAVGVQALDCDGDWHPLALDIVSEAQVPTGMPALPWNAPRSRNDFVDVKAVRRSMTAIDRNAAYWTAQCASGSLTLSNCGGG